ncbi:manganese ion Hypothetical protein [Nesidiocoris tenuis]|uniref:Cytosol aminopeptidase n=1 Tax=Nesidiocoris tenuis TaxID=355587 RepID=A0ABN7BFM6_9HEMI|nr:manganese ion Hypothetical protein [Nesidiocoris tenuis]
MLYKYSRTIINGKGQLKVLLQCLRNASTCDTNGKKGLVIGVYEGCCPGESILTRTGRKFNECVDGKLSELLKGTKIKKGKAQVFGNLGDEFYQVAAVGLGSESVGWSTLEGMDECKENIRAAAGAGAMALQDQGIPNIAIEEFTNAEAAAEGAALGVWRYQEWKNTEDRATVAAIDLYGSEERDAWIRGIVKAESQNMARELEEVPANLMTPTILCRFMQEHLCPCGAKLEVRDRDYLDTNGFTAFLTMAKGSCEQPAVVEIMYCGASPHDRPIGLIGKAVTFDSGGVNLKDCPMSEHRGDIAGAAVIIGVMNAICRMRLPLNVVAVLPVIENMPSGMAVKPGDVVMAKNGKTIRIEDTDNEGRVILADVMSYMEKHNPCLILNAATSNQGMKNSIGVPPTGVFSTSDIVWSEINRAGGTSGDRVWRFPFWKFYRSRVTNFAGVDTVNKGKGPGGWPCLGAAFLLEFVPPCIDFVHMDISGSGLLHTGIGMPYLRKNTMSGRPVRTIVQFLYQIACPHHNVCDC